MYMNEETKHMSTFNDIPVLLARIDDKLGIITAWIQDGASRQDPHAILTIDEAVAFTGYSKSAIHSATSKDTIPHFKRGNKLFFFKDELVEWLKSDNRPKRGKRFQINDSSKESVVTDGNQESVSITAETTNDTNSVAEVTDNTSNQQKRLHLYQKKPFLPVRVLRLQPFLRRYRMPGWSKTVLMMSPRTRQMNLLRHLAPMWTVVWTNERKCTVVMSPLLMNTYLMIVPDSRERKILFLLSLTLVLNGMKPPMAPLQGP